MERVSLWNKIKIELRNMYYRTLFKHSFLFGTLVGIMLILASMSFYLKGISINYNQTLLFINRFLIILGIYFGVRKYRDEVLLGIISYKHAFVAGVLIILVASFFDATYIYILTAYFDPNSSILHEAVDLTEKGFVKMGYNQEQIDLLMPIYRKITPGIFATSHWFGKVFGGVFFSFIVAFFLKKTRNLSKKSPIT